MKNPRQFLKPIKRLIKLAKKNNQNLLIIVVVMAAFVAGRLSYSIQQKLTNKKTDALKIAQQQNKTVKEFTTTKSSLPQLKFFVMSFCPYGNQAEAGLKPVFELLENKVEWQPQYIINKININEVCLNQVYDRNRCQDLIKQGYFPDQESCKKRFYPDQKTCLQEIKKQALMIDENNGFVSLHGRNELNQDIREICAWNIEPDKKKWWQFIDQVNKNCNTNNVESCWQDQAKAAGYEISKIENCFNQQTIQLLEKEAEIVNKYQVTGSPTILINETVYPPEGAYDQNAVLQIGNNIFEIKDYRLPNTFKEAICSAFQKRPKECSKQLAIETQNNPPAGSCGS